MAHNVLVIAQFMPADGEATESGETKHFWLTSLKIAIGISAEQLGGFVPSCIYHHFAIFRSLNFYICYFLGKFSHALTSAARSDSLLPGVLALQQSKSLAKVIRSSSFWIQNQEMLTSLTVWTSAGKSYALVGTKKQKWSAKQQSKSANEVCSITAATGMKLLCNGNIHIPLPQSRPFNNQSSF